MLIKALKMYQDATVPQRASSGAVGYDVFAYHVLDKITRKPCGELPATIKPSHSLLLGIGVKLAVPFPYDCQVRPRSGLAVKHDIELSNAPGTIDPDYRGEAGILLRNRGDKPFTVEKGLRVAQLVITRVEIPQFVDSEELPPTLRDTGGFGSTGFYEIAHGDAGYRAMQERWDRHFMGLAISAASLSNCLRDADREGGKYPKDSEGKYCGATRRFGCVLVKGQNVISQGFNTRTRECDEESGCIREREHIKSGTENDRGCLHAEQVAMQNYMRTGGASLENATVYVNSEPCVMCAKMLLRSGISTVVVPGDVYPTNGLKILADAGIEIRIINS